MEDLPVGMVDIQEGEMVSIDRGKTLVRDGSFFTLFTRGKEDILNGQQGNNIKNLCIMYAVFHYRNEHELNKSNYGLGELEIGNWKLIVRTSAVHLNSLLRIKRRA